jgi:adenine/guanine phosphoribosyltransferase-like PRPP-binding protein
VNHPEFVAMGYLTEILKDPRPIAERAAERLRGVDFDVIVVSGTSGLLIGPALAVAMGKRLAIVRKPNDASHSMHLVEGWYGGKWLFVDDLIDSGSTCRRVAQAYVEACASKGAAQECVGTYLYGDWGTRSGYCERAEISHLLPEEA